MASEQNSVESEDLNRFYKALHKTITDMGVTTEQKADIKYAIEILFKTFAKQVGKKCPAFRAKSIQGVGSFYENTKILKLDEFDFLYVIDSLSDKDAIEAVKQNTGGIVGVAIKAKDSQRLLKRGWLNVENGQYLDISAFFLQKRIIFSLTPIISFQKILIEVAEQFCNSGLSQKTKTGTLTFIGLESRHGPQTELWFEWKPSDGQSFVVKADILPVIRINNFKDLVNEDGLYYQELQNTGFIYVMPSKRRQDDSNLFVLTFTETERDLMFGLSDTHRIAYQCLKFLLLNHLTLFSPVYNYMQYFRSDEHTCFKALLKEVDYLTASSYVCSYWLKTALLVHTRNCNRVTSPELCARDVLQILIVGFGGETPYLPNIFLPNANLLSEFRKPLRGDVNILKESLAAAEMLQIFHSKAHEDGLQCGEDSENEDILLKGFQLLMEISDTYPKTFFYKEKTKRNIYNTYQFYKEEQRILSDENITPGQKEEDFNRLCSRYSQKLYLTPPSIYRRVLTKQFEEHSESGVSKIMPGVHGVWIPASGLIYSTLYPTTILDLSRPKFDLKDFKDCKTPVVTKRWSFDQKEIKPYFSKASPIASKSVKRKSDFKKTVIFAWVLTLSVRILVFCFRQSKYAANIRRWRKVK